jgi:hypothetical protein
MHSQEIKKHNEYLIFLFVEKNSACRNTAASVNQKKKKNRQQNAGFILKVLENFMDCK